MSVSVHTYIHSDLFSDVFLGARGGGRGVSIYVFILPPFYLSFLF